MTSTLIIGIDAIADVVADVGLDVLLDEMIESMSRTFDGHDTDQLLTFDRTGFHYTKPDLGLIEWMPAMDLGRLVSVKTVGYHPTNPTERGVPSVLASTALYDTGSGRLLALCEATLLTALRTGAASAVVTDILAVPDATTLGMIGCGAQAVTQIHAISRVRPITRVICFDIDADVAASLRSRVPLAEDVVFESVHGNDLARLVAQSDIICTATTVGIGDPPVLADGDHRPWLHINAVGADFPGKREIPTSMLQRAMVVPDVTAQCLKEGECQALAFEKVGPDFASLVSHAADHHPMRDRLTVFDSTGWALEDLVAAEIVLGHAQRIGAGESVDLQPIPRDPYDPYEFIRR